jgi:DNA-binding IclR family transcriptional regulator
MRAKPAYRDRDDHEVEILDALADRHEEGMTVFELRAKVGHDIDTIEDALADLNEDGLIEVSNEDGRTMIVPRDHVVGSTNHEDDGGFFDDVRDRLPF